MKVSKELPDPEVLRELLEYNPETGDLTWKARPVEQFSRPSSGRTWNSRFAGKSAGCVWDKTRIVVRIHGVNHQAHRVAWAIYHGKWPDGEIDHINHNPHDNRIENLRDVPHILNQRNMSLFANNTSGVSGVSYDKRRGQWDAFVWENNKQRRLGGFKEKADAVAARKSAEAKLSYHHNHGA